jgi:hypothetical protein
MQSDAERRQRIPPSSTPKWVWLLVGCGGAAGLKIIVICASLMTMTGGNEGNVRYANNMERYASRYIEEHRILDPGERLVAYYDNTLDLDATDAAILTDRRLLYHFGGQTTAIDLADIADVRTSDDPLLGDIIDVTGADGTIMHIEIAPLNGGDGFLHALDAQRAARRSGGASSFSGGL